MVTTINPVKEQSDLGLLFYSNLFVQIFKANMVLKKANYLMTMQILIKLVVSH